MRLVHDSTNTAVMTDSRAVARLAWSSGELSLAIAKPTQARSVAIFAHVNSFPLEILPCRSANGSCRNGFWPLHSQRATFRGLPRSLELARGSGEDSLHSEANSRLSFLHHKVIVLHDPPLRVNLGRNT
jgi:hypothetical protein